MANQDGAETGERNLPTAGLLAANFLAVVIYPGFASTAWVDPEIADIPGASGGGSLVWFLTTVPLILLSLLANTICLIWTVIRRYCTGSWYFWWWALPTLLGLWSVAIALDVSQHGR